MSLDDVSTYRQGSWALQVYLPTALEGIGLQHNVKHCNTLQHNATRSDALKFFTVSLIPGKCEEKAKIARRKNLNANHKFQWGCLRLPTVETVMAYF